MWALSSYVVLLFATTSASRLRSRHSRAPSAPRGEPSDDPSQPKSSDMDDFVGELSAWNDELGLVRVAKAKMGVPTKELQAVDQDTEAHIFTKTNISRDKDLESFINQNLEAEAAKHIREAFIGDGIYRTVDLMYCEVERECMPTVMAVLEDPAMRIPYNFIVKLKVLREAVVKVQAKLETQANSLHDQASANAAASLADTKRLTSELREDVLDFQDSQQESRSTIVPSYLLWKLRAVIKRFSQVAEAADMAVRNDITVGEIYIFLDKVDESVGHAEKALDSAEHLSIMDLISKKNILRGTLFKYPLGGSFMGDSVVRIKTTTNAPTLFTDPPDNTQLSFQSDFKSEEASQMAVSAMHEYGSTFTRFMTGALGGALGGITGALASTANLGHGLQSMLHLKGRKTSTMKTEVKIDIRSEPRGAIAINKEDLELRKAPQDQLIKIAGLDSEADRSQHLRKFFRTYGSHVCTKVTLGGVMTMKASLRASVQAESYAVQAALKAKMSASLAASGGFNALLAGNANLEVNKTDEIAKDKGVQASYSASELMEQVTVSREVLGGQPGLSPALWSLSLANNEKWQIIDKHVESCIPLWDFVDRDSHVFMNTSYGSTLPQLMFRTWYTTYLDLDTIVEMTLGRDVLGTTLIDLTEKYLPDKISLEFSGSLKYLCCCHEDEDAADGDGDGDGPSITCRLQHSDMRDKQTWFMPGCRGINGPGWHSWKDITKYRSFASHRYAGMCVVPRKHIPPRLSHFFLGEHLPSGGFESEDRLVGWLAAHQRLIQPKIEKLELCDQRNWCSGHGVCNTITGDCKCYAGYAAVSGTCVRKHIPWKKFLVAAGATAGAAGLITLAMPATVSVTTVTGFLWWKSAVTTTSVVVPWFAGLLKLKATAMLIFGALTGRNAWSDMHRGNDTSSAGSFLDYGSLLTRSLSAEQKDEAAQLARAGESTARLLLDDATREQLTNELAARAEATVATAGMLDTYTSRERLLGRLTELAEMLQDPYWQDMVNESNGERPPNLNSEQASSFLQLLSSESYRQELLSEISAQAKVLQNATRARELVKALQEQAAAQKLKAELLRQGGDAAAKVSRELIDEAKQIRADAHIKESAQSPENDREFDEAMKKRILPLEHFFSSSVMDISSEIGSYATDKKDSMVFKPGEIGLIADWDSGMVSEVDPDSQAAKLGVEVDWQIERINGQDYTEGLLGQCIKGKLPYAVQFLKPSTRWVTINSSAACEQNAEGIHRSSCLGAGYTLGSCKLACQATSACVAVDFYRKTGWCNLFNEACTAPQRMKWDASSYKLTGETAELSKDWAVISESAACEVNSENIRRTSALGAGHTLSSCKLACEASKSCVAIDFYTSTNWCNLFDEACSTPQRKRYRASSHRLSSRSRAPDIFVMSHPIENEDDWMGVDRYPDPLEKDDWMDVQDAAWNSAMNWPR